MNKLKQHKSVIIAVIICIILCTVTGTVLYHKGYNDNIPVASDGSPTVYITPTGKRYHLQKCDYIGDNSIPISVTEARNKGYTSCRKCKPDKRLKLD